MSKLELKILDSLQAQNQALESINETIRHQILENATLLSPVVEQLVIMNNSISDLNTTIRDLKDVLLINKPNNKPTKP